jgi:two-component system, NtrC family, response regulator AtoC
LACVLLCILAIMKDIYQIFFQNSPRMTRIKSVIDEIAKTDVTVLIKGESGTGKGLVAHTIHLNSERREKPFVKVNCAALPRGLLESELFGFEKGAFTGANLKKPGKFELANNGTILLNEIGEIDISLQAKLLQVLQDSGFSRLGGESDIVVNTRVVATTKDHLEKSMAEGRFREDLFFRINVMTITVPPLRERKEQILPLAQYFFNLYKTKYERPIPVLSPKVIEFFKNYHWPGNLRELENMVKRVVIFGEEEMARDAMGKQSAGNAESLGKPLPTDPKGGPGFFLKEIGKKAAEMAEREIIQSTLQETHWNRKAAAKLLRVSYKALLYKIQKYRLDDIGGIDNNREEKDDYRRGAL